MTGIAWAPIGQITDHLVVIDATRRLYAGLSREGDYWHVIQPVRIDDRRIDDTRRIVGQLSCSCNGGVYRSTCYRVEQAEAFEAGRMGPFVDGPDWLKDAAPGEIVEMYGS